MCSGGAVGGIQKAVFKNSSGASVAGELVGGDCAIDRAATFTAAGGLVLMYTSSATCTMLGMLVTVKS